MTNASIKILKSKTRKAMNIQPRLKLFGVERRSISPSSEAKKNTARYTVMPKTIRLKISFPLILNFFFFSKIIFSKNRMNIL